MLGKKKDFAEEKIQSLIGEDVVIEGNMTLKDAVRIDGKIKGDITSKGSLFVGKNGVIEGNIQAVNIMIAGTINGNMNITERIEATATSKIKGDIVAKSLVIDENAAFEGNCTMNMNGKSAVEPEIQQ
ncbi:MAG: polymer-forming cytoskeletal protein [Lachnospiraceae bacterium]|nr:polymer-forming cytoskeletal protein [Lachnospiraceae bacterium]